MTVETTDLQAKALAFAETYRDQFDELDTELTKIAAEYFRKVSDTLYEIDNRESKRTRDGGFVGRAPMPSFGALTWDAENTNEGQIAFTEVDYDDNITIPWTIPWRVVTDLPGAVTERIEEVLEYRKKRARDNITSQKRARENRIAGLESALAKLRAEQTGESDG